MLSQIPADFDWGAFLLLLIVAIGILWALRMMLRKNRQDLKSLEAELAEDQASGSADSPAGRAEK
ncbi:MAG TPA: hypothetical protein PLB97_03405 [Accumulibacter sp.]|jgi:uncharacterized membrane protein YqjE|nr:hypothetical protein [Accumulibacter sp.]